MAYFRLAFTAVFVFISFGLQAQTVSLIGASEEFILENVRGYAISEHRAIEHEEFDVLVFEDKDREVSFFFTFYKGAKICSFIKNRAPLPSLGKEIDYVQTNFRKIQENIWEKPDKRAQVQISESDGMVVILAREIRE